MAMYGVVSLGSTEQRLRQSLNASDALGDMESKAGKQAKQV